MKKLLFILFASALAFASVQAQTTFKNSNLVQNITRSKTTTNATPATVETVAVDSNEVGIVTVKVIGLKSDGSAGITGVKTYRYTKVGGTLTLGTALTNTADAVTVDSGIAGATFAAAASSGNVAVSITGVASTTIYWKVVIQRFSLSKAQ